MDEEGVADFHLAQHVGGEERHGCGRAAVSVTVGAAVAASLVEVAADVFVADQVAEYSIVARSLVPLGYSSLERWFVSRLSASRPYARSIWRFDCHTVTSCTPAPVIVADHCGRSGSGVLAASSSTK